MKIIGERLKLLREGIKLSQAKLGKLVGTTQVNIGRYEMDICSPPPETILWYADYFDVSLDFIYGRTDKPQGKLYEYKPKITEDSEEMRRFVEMCFDPKSPMNDRLKQTILDMLKGGKSEKIKRERI